MNREFQITEGSVDQIFSLGQMNEKTREKKHVYIVFDGMKANDPE